MFDTEDASQDFQSVIPDWNPSTVLVGHLELVVHLWNVSNQMWPQPLVGVPVIIISVVLFIPHIVFSESNDMVLILI